MLQRLSSLQIALLASLAVHGALLTVRLADPAALDRIFQDTPLEVVLVNAKAGEAPAKAQAIAQVNLAGGGSAERGRATSPLPPAQTVEAGNASSDSRQQIEQLQQAQQQLLAHLRRELAILAQPDVRRDAGTPEARAQEERRRQLVRMLAEIERRVNEENARPKKRYIRPGPARQEIARRW